MRFKGLTLLNFLPYSQMVIFLLILIIGIRDISAEESSLNMIVMEIKPQTCVSLHEGQACFTKVIVNWQADLVNDYCLYSTQSSEPIICWEKANEGSVEFELNTENNINFMLAQTPDTRYMLTQKPYAIIAEAKLTVSWVYKKKKKSSLSWRLF